MRVRCPHCHNAIEFVGDHDLTDIQCPSCGSAFNLLLPDTESWSPTPKWLDHFQLLDKLGTGGFGTVWKARDSKLDRLVAVKIPRRSQVNPAEEETFLREARAAAQLRHPSIVAVHEVGRQEGGNLYIVSDFVQGMTLADRLASDPFTPREAAQLCAQIADALHHAHESGVIHRDLKPSNIMLDSEGLPHLMDFGLAKREAGEITMTVEGKLLGTPAYMSPEQARGEGHHVDRRTDVYSLGVILFELLTGERPFRGNQRMLLHQVINEEPPRLRALDNGIPRDLDIVCTRCLEKQPANRPPTAAFVSAELKRFLNGLPIESKPPSNLLRLSKWIARNPVVSKLVAALLILSFVAGSSLIAILWISLSGLSADDILYWMSGALTVCTLLLFVGIAMSWLKSVVYSVDRLRHKHVPAQYAVPISKTTATRPAEQKVGCMIIAIIEFAVIVMLIWVIIAR